MTIRKATPEDILCLMSIYREARQKQLDSGNLHQWKEGYPSQELILRDIECGYSHVVEDSGRAVGVFSFIPGEDPTYRVIYDGAWKDTQTSYATIHRLGSAKDSKGVAAVVFDWCWKRIHNLRVDTHADNAIMRHCIEKAGFSYCGVIHLLNGDPRLAYQKFSL